MLILDDKLIIMTSADFDAALSSPATLSSLQDIESVIYLTYVQNLNDNWYILYNVLKGRFIDKFRPGTTHKMDVNDVIKIFEIHSIDMTVKQLQNWIKSDINEYIETNNFNDGLIDQNEYFFG